MSGQLNSLLSARRQSYTDIYEQDRSKMENSTIFKSMSTYRKKSNLKLMPYVLYEKYLAKPQRKIILTQSCVKMESPPKPKIKKLKPQLPPLAIKDLQPSVEGNSIYHSLRSCVTPRSQSELSKFNTTVANYGRKLDTNLNGLIINKKDKRFQYRRRRFKIKSRNYNRLPKLRKQKVRIKKAKQEKKKKKEMNEDEAASTIQVHFRKKQKKKKEKPKQKGYNREQEKNQEIDPELMNPDNKEEMDKAASKIQGQFRKKKSKKSKKVVANPAVENRRLVKVLTRELMNDVLDDGLSNEQFEHLQLAKKCIDNLCNELLDLGL